MPLKWIPRSKSGASKSRPRWAAHTRIGNVWECPPRGLDFARQYHREDTGNIDKVLFHLFVILDSLAADFLEEHRRVLDQRLQPVIREITDSRARTRDELEGIIIELLL